MDALPLERLREGLREQTAGLARTMDGTDPDRHVPTCPKWCLRDLVAHVGDAHRWAADLVERRATEPVPMNASTAPQDPRGWSGWLLEGVERLAGAVDAVGPDTVVWTFLGPRPPRFWVRRMLHDTAVHHADAAISVGGDFALAPDLAADALCEALEMLSGPDVATLKPALAGLRGSGERLRLHPDEPGVAGWLITRAPDGVAWERADDAKADVTLRGPVAELLLVFARRLPPDDPRITVSGDRSLLDHWLSLTAFE